MRLTTATRRSANMRFAKNIVAVLLMGGAFAELNYSGCHLIIVSLETGDYGSFGGFGDR
jgi:hypothetical protein